MENLTDFLRQAFVMVGARHKERLGVGILIGIVILFFHTSLVAAAFLPSIPTVISVLGSIALGVLIMFLFLWRDPKKLYIGEEEQKLLAIMDELSSRSGLSSQQKKFAYAQMLNKLVSHYDPNKPLEIEEDAVEAIREARAIKDAE